MFKNKLVKISLLVIVGLVISIFFSMPSFAKGKIQVTVTDNDGWGEGRVYYYKWDNEKREYYEVCDYDLSHGKDSTKFAPGIYKIKVKYCESAPVQYKEIENIQIEDKITRSFSFKFGNMANKFTPPIINVWGPLEVGNGNGEFEVGEEAAFRFQIYDDNLEKTVLMVNKEVVKEFYASGFYKWNLPLTSSGICMIEIRANDFNQPPNFNSWVCKIAVSTPSKNLKTSIKKGYTLHQEKDITGNNMIDSLLNYCLHKANINPNSEEAKLAKKLAKDVFNPFKSRDEMEKDIQDIVNKILNQK